MTRTFEQFVQCVILWEYHRVEGDPLPPSTYSDTPGDNGGATNLGVTLATLNGYRAAHGLTPVTGDYMKTLTIEEATEVYWEDFYVGPALDRLPTGSLLALEVFDIAVGSGPFEAILTLQETLQAEGYPCSCDGKISTDRTKASQTATLAAQAWAEKGGALVEALINRRIDLYKRIVIKNPSQGIFLTGWEWRANRLLAEAQATGPGA